MLNIKFKSICKVFTLFVCLVSLNSAWGEERSFWQRFANFFTPTGSVKGEGPVFDELRSVESQIDKIEVQYSRERRPGNKTRYRKQLDSLRNVRDSLITVIEKMPSSVTSVAQSSSSAAQSSSSAVVSVPVANSSSATIPASSTANVVCSRDTVFVHDTLVVRDTVVIHDTLYVVLANKPEAAPKTAPSKAKKK
jgi:hypothetical protein